MIEFQNVSKTFNGGIDAVIDVSFKIEKGEFVFLIGPSGSGKTTLIEMLIRDVQPTAGKIFFDGGDITNVSRKKVYKLRRQIGVIFQDYKLIPDKTAAENVAFAMEAAGRSNKEINEKVPYLLDVVGLGNRMDSFPKQLSGGEQQRVAIARAMANNPKFLIADEPTGNLDPASSWDIVQILAKINSWGTTIIMTTHGTDIVNTLNKRVIQMDKGKVIRDDSKGGYEFYTDGETSNSNDIKEEKVTRKKFKVNLSAEVTANEIAKQQEEDMAEVAKSHEKGKKVSRWKFWSKTRIENEELKMQNEKPINLTQPKIDTNQVTDLLEKAKSQSIDYMNLPGKLIKKLKKGGYNNMAEIIEAGPESLAEKSVITPEEVILVAKAIEKNIKS